jgi:hypothetical protein
VSASKNDDDEKKDAKDSTENSFDDYQYIDSSLYISDEDDTMEKLKRRIKKFGEKFQEAAATRKKNAAAKQKMAEARAKKKAEEEAEKAEEEARMKAEEEAEKAEEEARKKNSTDGDYQDPDSAEWTGDEISDSVVMSDIHQSQPQHESQVEGQHNPMMTVVLPQKAGNTGLTVAITVVAVICGLAIVTVLAGILYVWANNLADDNIEGTWYNPVDTMTFSSDGSMEESTGTLIEWRTDNKNLYMVSKDDQEHEYYFRYKISDDVLFMAPYDHDLVTVIGEDCVAYSKSSTATDEDDYSEQIVRVAWPDWCTPEE